MYLLLSELFPLFSARQTWSIRTHTDSRRVILVRLIIITISWISLTLNILTTHFILRVHMHQDGNAWGHPIYIHVTTTLQVPIWRGRQDQRTHQADWQPGSANRPTLATSRYHSNYRDPLRSREEGCQRSSHYLSAIYRSERERGREIGKGTQTQRHETAIFEVHLQSTDFSSSQSLWAISTCNNPPLLLLRLSGWPDIKSQDLSVCLSICLWLDHHYVVPNFVVMSLLK